MVYNNGFPMNYPYYQQPFMPQQAQMVQQQQQQPIQGAFVRVRDENEARMYCVAPGNSMTFVDEDAKHIFTKTVNMGQLDRPVFKRYRLVSEDDASVAMDPAQKPQEDHCKYALAADMDAFKAELEAIKADLYGIAGKKKASKKEVTEDE